MPARHFIAGVAVFGLAALASWAALTLADAPEPWPGEIRATITGGHDTDPVDRGRPVKLVAAALGVPEKVFRDAFRHVRPARDGGPTREEAQRNKHELLSRLETYGVTNERLDEVSDFYRYRPQTGELWKHQDAVVFATVKDGRVTNYRVAEAGYGYSSPPAITVPGANAGTAKVVLRFDKDLTKNGAVESINLSVPTTAP